MKSLSICVTTVSRKTLSHRSFNTRRCSRKDSNAFFFKFRSRRAVTDKTVYFHFVGTDLMKSLSICVTTVSRKTLSHRSFNTRRCSRKDSNAFFFKFRSRRAVTDETVYFHFVGTDEIAPSSICVTTVSRKTFSHRSFNTR
jgi:hypothetical protein